MSTERIALSQFALYPMSIPSVPVMQRPTAARTVDPVWWSTALALATLLTFSSTYLWSHVWDNEAYSHGPVVVAIVVWLVCRHPVPPVRTPTPAEQGVGWLLLLTGLSLYVVGRSQSLPLFDMAGLPVVAAGLLLLVAGSVALKAYRFPLLFLLLLIPLPTPMLEVVTGPMRHVVSVLTEMILYATGYPVARSGVVLSIGQYQLLVSEACSGLNSLLSLSAMALLYVYLMRYRNVWRNAALLAAIVPIALGANLVRVLFLVLLTYHAGDEVGQSFMHGFAGMFLFLMALLLLFAVDRLFARVPALADFREPA